MPSNTQRFKRLFKSGSATPLAIGAGVGAVVGLFTGGVLVCAAVGAAAGAALGLRERKK